MNKDYGCTVSPGDATLHYYEFQIREFELMNLFLLSETVSGFPRVNNWLPDTAE